MNREERIQLVAYRCQTVLLLLEFYRRAMKERKFIQASMILRHRLQMLRKLRENRGYEI